MSGKRFFCLVPYLVVLHCTISKRMCVVVEVHAPAYEIVSVPLPGYSGLLYSGLLLPHELAALLLPPALREYHYVEEPFASDVMLTPLLKLGWGKPWGCPCKHEQLMTKQCGCSKIHGLLGERDGI